MDMNIMNYIKLAHPVMGLVDFSPRDYQINMLNDLRRRAPITIFKSARQIGLSSVIMAHFFEEILRPNTTILIRGSKTTNLEFIGKMAIAYDAFPIEIKCKLGAYIDEKRRFIEFSNGSKITTIDRTDAHILYLPDAIDKTASEFNRSGNYGQIITNIYEKGDTIFNQLWYLNLPTAVYNAKYKYDVWHKDVGFKQETVKRIGLESWINQYEFAN